MQKKFVIVPFKNAPFEKPIRYKGEWHFRAREVPCALNTKVDGLIRSKKLGYTILVAVEKQHVGQWDSQYIVEEFEITKD